MIKKLLFTATLIIAGTVLLNAQCTPDITCTALVCPDTNTAAGGNLPHAQGSTPYSTSLTVNVPVDTLYMTQTVPIDSFKYTSTTGLPTGFIVTPNQSSWPGGTQGCILISGTPADSMQGKKYNLIITTTAYFKFALQQYNMPLVLNGYKIIVDSSNGVSNYDLNKFSLEQNTPNPFSKSTTILFSSKVNDTYNFIVYNVIGDIVYTIVINAVVGENRIEFSSEKLSSGIYMYKLSNNEQAVTKRMIVAGK
jgi:hypothetical protein